MLATVFFVCVNLAIFTLLAAGGPRLVFARMFVAVSFVFVNLGFFLSHVNNTTFDSDSETGLMVTTLGLLCVVIGMLIGYEIFRRPSQFGRSAKSALLVYQVERAPGMQLFMMALVILVPTWSYFFFLGFVPLFDGVSAVLNSGLSGLGVLNESRLSRDAYVNADAVRVPLQGLLEIFRNIGVPVLFAYSLVQIRQGSKAFPRVLLMMICVVSVMAAGQRWPLMYLLFAAIFVLVIEGRGLSSKPVRIIGGLAVIGGVVLSALQSRTTEQFHSIASSIWFGLENLIWRITVGQVQVPIDSYSSDDPTLRWQMGATYMQNLAAYLPGPGASYPVDFYQKVTGDTIGFTAPPDLYTEAYINFSWIGVVALSIVWGLIMVVLENRVFNSGTSWDVALRSALLTILVFSSLSGASFTLSFVFVSVACLIAREIAILLSRNARPLLPGLSIPGSDKGVFSQTLLPKR